VVARTRVGSRATATLLAAIAVGIAGTAASAGAQSRFVSDGTTCAVSLTARHANVDCTFAVATVDVALPGGAWRAGVAADGAQYTHDGRGTLVAISPATGALTRYTYNAAGRLASAHIDGGVATEFVYRESGALERIAGAGGVTEFAYDGGGRVVAVRPAQTGETTEYGYDELGRLAGVSVRGTAVSFTYGRDSLVRVEATGETTEYTYDERHALTAVDAPAAAVTYTYDTRGNVRTATNTASTTEYSYDRGGRIVSRSTAGRVTLFTYDARGNLVSGEGGVTYSYDDGGSLLSVTSGATDVALDYAPNGHVAAIRPEDGGATRIGYDELGRLELVFVPQGDDTVVAFYEGLPNEPYVLEIHWNHSDGSFLWVRSDGRIVACRDCP